MKAAVPLNGKLNRPEDVRRVHDALNSLGCTPTASDFPRVLSDELRSDWEALFASELARTEMDVQAAASIELYEKLHASNADFRNNNQGLACLDSWIGKLSAGVNGDQKVIETGCGNGLLCKELATRGFDVTGIDLADGGYDRCGYKFVQMDARMLLHKFGADSFDACLCFDVLEHLDENNVVFVLKQISQVAPKLIATAACYGSPPLHLTVRSPGWWLDEALKVCPHKTWKVLSVFDRYTYCPVILLYGENKNA